MVAPLTVVTLSQRRVLYWHAGVVAVLAFLHASMQVAQMLWGGAVISKLALLFDLDMEANIPSAFQAGALLGSALLLLVVARHHVGTTGQRWLLLAATLAYMSFDEIGALHERTAGLLAILMGSEKNFADWLFVFVPIALGIAAYVLPLLRAVSRRTGIGLAAAGLVYLGGAVGMEIAAWSLAQTWGFHSVRVKIAATVEETLEMIGIVILVQVLLGHMRHQSYALTLAARP